MDYFRVTGLVGNASMPWSGAFLAWAIKESGNTDKLPLSASNLVIWNDAVAKRLTFLPKEKIVLPGDIVIFPRTTASDLDTLRSGHATSAPAHSGIVYAADEDGFAAIEANVANALHLRRHRYSEKIIGFIRLGGSS